MTQKKKKRTVKEEKVKSQRQNQPKKCWWIAARARKREPSHVEKLIECVMTKSFKSRIVSVKGLKDKAGKDVLVRLERSSDMERMAEYLSSISSKVHGWWNCLFQRGSCFQLWIHFIKKIESSEKLGLNFVKMRARGFNSPEPPHTVRQEVEM